MKDVTKGQEYACIMNDLDKGIRYVVSAHQGENAKGSFESCLKALIGSSISKIVEDESNTENFTNVA